MRASQRRQRIIEVTAGPSVGGRRRADVLHHWFPGIDASEVEGRHPHRHARGSGSTLVEDIVTNDALQRRFQYRITGGFFKEHLGTIDVIELAADRCLVAYASDADPATMAIVLGGAMAGALTELAASSRLTPVPPSTPSHAPPIDAAGGID